MAINKELEVINFTNISNNEWSHTWGGEVYTFKPGETRAFPRFLAEFFAKHLGDRLLIDAGRDSSMESPERKVLTEQMIGKVSVPEDISAPEARETFDEALPPDVEFEDVPKEEPVVPAEPVVIPKKRGRKPKVA